MTRDYAAFVRNCPTASMAPLRQALVDLGLTHVASFGASGNFVFCAPGAKAARLEERITAVVGGATMVRTRDELAEIVAKDPHVGRAGAHVFLAREPVDPKKPLFREASGPDGEPPIALGTTVYFAWPTRLADRKAVVNFERELGVTGTMRTVRVVGRVLALM